MAVLNIPAEHRQLNKVEEIQTYLANLGISYEQWRPAHPLGENATPDEILAAYAADIDRMKAAGGYTTADVIDIKPDTPNLDAMLDKFNKEHWHDEDEVRFILAGHGQFYIHPPNGPVIGIEVGPSDLLVVPRGTYHWFDLLADRRVRAIRLFQDPAGWTPQYTGSGEEVRVAEMLS
ncbi:MAG: acireductone dioxygenase [Cyanobacteria bacterium P01_G01_bin.38]